MLSAMAGGPPESILQQQFLPQHNKTIMNLKWNMEWSGISHY